MKILIAEDDLDLNKIICKKLTADGHSVDACYDGEQALDHLSFANYDVAILDIMMPIMDGLKAVKELRSQGNLTPVIFLTAKDSISDKVTGLDVGANDYLVKPFSFQELNARIRAVTRTSKGLTSDVVTLSDLSVDCTSHIVKRGDKVISLSGKEYQLLEFLIRNKNRILSRDKILSHVWGYDFEGGEGVVDVYISYLRRKIDDGYPLKLIQTARGIGYIMRE
ncbi:MAG: response regulator transcription factor [Lachnospiraceae bacterium]|nr:response regulator transcription factor [Lachnospiraceae bacterium]